MGRRLVFTFNRETLQFVVLKKEIFYTDKVWKNWVRILPKDEKLIRKMAMSRNRIPPALVKLFTFSKKEIEEYSQAKDEAELVEIVVRDAKLKGCKLEKNMEVENEV